ncbi:hypothetical protein BJ6T_82980 [Bradyrhizobium japonicum USDA 6]|nr:hypothetical protein BJ6T_82980 [Bradyrhizobium japonicum USDA 6]
MYDRKLIAPQPGDGINLADTRAQSVGDRAKQPITHRVAQGVIDLFEIIQIQAEHRKAGTPADLRDGVFNALGEQ